jgi:spore coat protein I
MMYRYPEKFWKVSNRYMNSRKSWLSPVNMEKLQRVISDEQEKIKILREFSSYYGVHKNDF